MASQFSVIPSMPRIIEIILPLIHHKIIFVGQLKYICWIIISELNYRFFNPSVIIALIRLRTELLVTFEEIKDLGKVLVESYKEHLPNLEVLYLEFFLWKNKWIAKTENIPSTLPSALRSYSKKIFPILHTLLQISCSMLISSCECERSFSTLHKLRI